MRITQLDLLRLLACLLVFGRHMEVCPIEASHFFHAITVVLERGGWIGVDLFFVLSGFLVSGLLFRESRRSTEEGHAGGVQLKRFLIRRGLKIYPAFYVLFIYSIVFNKLIHRPMTAEAIIAEGTFFQNYFQKLQPHTWSLAVEEHFYLLLALLFAWLTRPGRSHADRNPFRHLPIIFAVVAVVALGLRVWVNATKPFEFPSHMFHTQIRIDSLGFGVLLAYGVHRGALLGRKVYRWRWFLAIVGCAALVPPFLFPIDQTPWLRHIGFTVIYIGSGMLLLGLLHIKVGVSALVRFLAWLGTHSYSIYLWHMPVNGAIKRIIPKLVAPEWQWHASAFAFVTLSLIVGVVMAKVVEFPVLRLRERWFPSMLQPKPGDIDRAAGQ